MRDTEEPESRPRSRMSTEDEASKDDLGSWGRREDDSMTEASLALADQSSLSKKRKLELSIESALKRQKKSDEELFGVRINRVDLHLNGREDSEDITLDIDAVDSSLSRSETPVSQVTKGSKKKLLKQKKKTKKQLCRGAGGFEAAAGDGVAAR